MSTEGREQVIAADWWRWLTDEQNARIVERIESQRAWTQEDTPTPL